MQKYYNKFNHKGLLFTAVIVCAVLLTAGCGKSAKNTAMEKDAASVIQEVEQTASEITYQKVPVKDNYRTYYEVFVYSFFDGNGDGIGDLKGLTQKLDYINDGKGNAESGLSCNGIWLMPVMPSPSYHKYDVTDYYAIDKEYGTMEDFETFLSECNKREIKVIMDLVINHTSSEHEWFKEACNYMTSLGDKEPSYEECPYAEYYNFSKEKKEAYYLVPGSDVWYYEARFYDGMPDLNLSCEALRKEMVKIAEFWLDKGVGGFRLDAAKEYVTGVDQANIDILSWFNRAVKGINKDAYLVAEVWTDLNTYANYYDSGINSIFNFEFANSEGIIANAVKGGLPAESYSKALENCDFILSGHNPDYIDAPFYTNHDMGRSAGYYSGEFSESQTKLAGGLNLLMSGSAFVYYGEELGMKGAGKDENKRAPMYFSTDSDTAGMCTGPLSMENVKMKYGSLEQQQQAPGSIYKYYRDAIRLRNKYPVIVKGKVKNLAEYSGEKIAAFSKTYEKEQVFIFCNISSETNAVTLSEEVPVEITDGLYTGDEDAEIKEKELILPPYGIAILKGKQ